MAGQSAPPKPRSTQGPELDFESRVRTVVVEAALLHSAHSSSQGQGKPLLLVTSVGSAIWLCVSFQDGRSGTTPQRQMGTILGVSHDQKLRFGNFPHLQMDGFQEALSSHDKAVIQYTSMSSCSGSVALKGTCHSFPTCSPLVLTSYLLEKLSLSPGSKQHRDLRAHLPREWGGSHTR